MFCNMAGKKRFGTDDIIKAIQTGQTPMGAAKVLGCTPETIRNYAKRYPSVALALVTERQNTVDLAERGLRSAVVREEPWAIAFSLKTLAKDIYSERQEITGRDGEALSIATRVVRTKADNV